MHLMAIQTEPQTTHTPPSSPAPATAVASTFDLDALLSHPESRSLATTLSTLLEIPLDTALRHALEDCLSHERALSSFSSDPANDADRSNDSLAQELAVLRQSTVSDAVFFALDDLVSFERNRRNPPDISDLQRWCRENRNPNPIDEDELLGYDKHNPES